MTVAACAVVGAGPAGLFAAETLLSGGRPVRLYDAMPSCGRKFLVAGNAGGLNITNAAPEDSFASRYGDAASLFSGLLRDFSPDDLKAWLAGFGVSCRTGSGGKVFPDGIAVRELLDAWFARLTSNPLFSFFPGHRFTSLARDGALEFETAHGPVSFRPGATVFALGGASWPATGSDGSWQEAFAAAGVAVVPFKPANCGYEADWDSYLASRFTHVPLKNVAVRVMNLIQPVGPIEHGPGRGEIMLTPYGVEGGPIYALGRAIRATIEGAGSCELRMDLLPDHDAEWIAGRLSGSVSKESLSNLYRKRLGLTPEGFALLRHADPEGHSLRDPAAAAMLVKQVPIRLLRARPIAEAISSAGGIALDEVDESLMLRRYPGIFCAGEMLDWEAPTGGFLLQGCFSTARRAASGALAWLDGSPTPSSRSSPMSDRT